MAVVGELTWGVTESTVYVGQTVTVPIASTSNKNEVPEFDSAGVADIVSSSTTELVIEGLREGTLSVPAGTIWTEANPAMDMETTNSFTLTVLPDLPKLYGSVNGLSKKIQKMYGPVETAVVTGVTGTVRAGSPGIGAGIQFDGAVFYNYVKNTIDLTKTPDYLSMHVGRFGGTYTLTLYYTDGTSYAFENGSYKIDPSLYGITWTDTPVYTGDDYIDLTATTALVSLSKEIKKLYGSVNGQAKLLLDNS